MPSLNLLAPQGPNPVALTNFSENKQSSCYLIREREVSPVTKSVVVITDTPITKDDAKAINKGEVKVVFAVVAKEAQYEY